MVLGMIPSTFRVSPLRGDAHGMLQPWACAHGYFCRVPSGPMRNAGSQYRVRNAGSQHRLTNAGSQYRVRNAGSQHRVRNAGEEFPMPNAR